MKHLSVLACALWVLLTACGDQPADREETITKFKILAVRADEPDVHPGQITRVHVLVGSPTPTSFTTFIMPFSQDAAADFGGGRARFGESGTAFNFFPGVTQPVLPVDLGVPLGGRALPNFGSAFYQAPATVGTYTLAVFAKEGAPAAGEFLGAPERAQAALQAQLSAALKAFKAIRVRPEGDTLNTNPVVTRMTVEKRWAKVIKEGEKKKAIAPAGFTLLPEELIRVKTQITDENVKRASTVWWVTGGTVEGYGRQDVDFRAPKKKGIVTLIALVLDREGGNNWYFQDVAVGVNSLVPDITDEKASSAYLALSGGRMQWLGFADEASAAVAVSQLNAGVPIVLAGTVTAEPAARLGWYLANPVYLGASDDITASVTASDIVAPPAKPFPVRMRFDGLVAGRARTTTGRVWSEPGETRAVVIQPAD